MKDPISKWANNAQKRNSIEAQEKQNLNDQAINALSNQYEFINHLKKRDVIAKDELDHAQEHHGVDSQRTLQSLAKLMIIREITHEYKKITGQDE
tara:strand:+ start:577 stop:861 length:285 start_codon:yes stop_codon:yes gene_type:complete